MNILQKLRKEWKTFALSVSVAFVSGYDVVVEVARQYGYDYTQLIKSEWRIYIIPAFAVGMLALRKWTTSISVDTPTVETPVIPVPGVPEVDTPEVK